MLSINQAKKIVAGMQKKAEKMKINEKITKDTMILSMHESATKLWIAYGCKKGKKEIEKRICNALFGALFAAEVFGIKNLEKIFLNRLEDIKEELKYHKNKKK